MTITRISKVISEAKPETVSPEILSWLQGQPCEGSKFHSPTPLLVRPHYLSEEVWRAADIKQTVATSQEGMVYLCSTCMDNLTVYLSILYAYDGLMPKNLRRDFGNTIRDLGDRAWAYSQGVVSG